MAEVAPAGAKEVDQRPNTHDPFWDNQNDILKTYSFNYEALTAYKQKLHRSYCLATTYFPAGVSLCACRHPLHAIDATPARWRGDFLIYIFSSLWLISRCDMANIRDEVNARHIALTADGLRYLVDKHPSQCRLQCQGVGRSSPDRALRQDHRLRCVDQLQRPGVDSLVDFRS